MNIIHAIYSALYERYNDAGWWPAETPYEVILGSILTQHTSWDSVEKVLSENRELLRPEDLLNMDTYELMNRIKPAGSFTRKAECLKAVTKWFKGYGYDSETVGKEPLEKLRNELLGIKGIGRETADSILLYAFDRLTFVVDAYTSRLVQRFPVDVMPLYDTIQRYFAEHIAADVSVYKNYHALIVINGKGSCRARPCCEGCPLSGQCKKRLGERGS